jgi:glutamine amidotransferase-like uncharacterized protein
MSLEITRSNSELKGYDTLTEITTYYSGAKLNNFQSSNAGITLIDARIEIKQIKYADVSKLNGSASFTNADILAQVRYAARYSNASSQLFSATASQTVFNLTNNITGDYLVFVSGAIQTAGFTKTGDNQITFTTGLAASTQVLIVIL